MIYNGIIAGRYVDLRSATLDDAEFTLNLRLDPEIRKCFPPFDSNLEKQKIWLTNQMQKDNDYFFIIIDKQNNQRIGTISVYGVDYETREAESGRIVIKKNSRFQSVEAQFLINHFAFYDLGLNLLHVSVRSENQRAINFHKFLGFTVFPPRFDNKMGCSIVPGELFKKDFEKIESNYKELLYKE